MGNREIVALGLAPLPVIVLMTCAILMNFVAGGTGDATGADVIMFALTLAVFGYVATFLFGLPIHLMLRWFHKTALLYYLGAAALPFALLAGALAAWRGLAPPPAPPINPHGLYMEGGVVVAWLLAFAAMVALTAATFWFLGVRQRGANALGANRLSR